ncbi:unnamed protein product [Onchocerca ochengi]|uniref:Ras-associating domain-containing protein n=1 Tax=Onchocerca ochengi TaxID=42157 RepID=A0A182EVH3_ONCOC|nr:unnamed protein product [Onchocerca ochengi]
MTSRTSPQNAVVPLNTGQLATSSVCNQKQPSIVNAVPVQLRQLLQRFYDLEEGADLYVLPNDPNKVVLLHVELKANNMIK